MSNHSESSGDEDVDLSPLEYARLNGLSRDYLAKPYFVCNLATVEREIEDGLTDSNLPKFQLPETLSLDERLTVSKEAAQLLASICRADTFESIDTLALYKLCSKELKNRPLELPLLRSDHETDCQRFRQREGFEMTLKDVKLPLEIVGEENNAGSVWSSRFWNLGVEMLKNLKKEKLEVSRDTLGYLQNTLKYSWTEADELEVGTCVKEYKKNAALKPVTPPLSPMSLPPHLYEPTMSSPAFQLPILSDPASLTSEDLKTIERRIFERDAPTPIQISITTHDTNSPDTFHETVKLGDMYSPLVLFHSPLSTSTIEIQQLMYKDLKVEGPLTPSAKLIALPKSVRFSDMITDCPLTIGSPPVDPVGSSFFDEAFAYAHERATRLAEQEALIEADATARVDVPIMDFSLPDPPWKINQSDLSSRTTLQAAVMGRIVIQIPQLWRGSRQDEIKLRWHPFPNNLAKVALEESFNEDDTGWNFFVKGPGDDEVMDTSSLTWKLPGLRILRDDDDNDEIKLGEFQKGIDEEFSFLVRQKTLEIKKRCNDRRLGKQALGDQIPKPNDFISAAQKLQLDLSDAERSGLLMGEAFSVGHSVDNYLELRGTKRQKIAGTWCFSKTSGNGKSATEPPHDCIGELSTRQSPVTNNSPLPAPPILIPKDPISIMVSSTLLRHRALIHHIEALIPKLTLIERDFSGHNQTTWMPHSVARSPLASPLTYEADIIVSPLVGIIITTLQQIKQKSLPGQKSKSVIRDRLEKVSLRYEKLIVLVSEGRVDDMVSNLDENDCIAFSEFVGFALGLETAIDVQLVGVGEETLAKWLANAIVQHNCGKEPLQLETHWELFLRRAGLNAFAAQYIIEAVKVPDDADLMIGFKVGQFGLPAFVKMSMEQRIARFGPICGKRLLERVSAVVDATWE